MTTEIVLSPVRDEKMNSDIKNSPVWKKAYKPEEVTEEVRAKHNAWFEYHVRFENTVPIHCTKFKEL